jgi:hypothetical protein
VLKQSKEQGRERKRGGKRKHLQVDGKFSYM